MDTEEIYETVDDIARVEKELNTLIKKLASEVDYEISVNTTYSRIVGVRPHPTISVSVKMIVL